MKLTNRLNGPLKPRQVVELIALWLAVTILCGGLAALTHYLVCMARRCPADTNGVDAGERD